MKLSRDEKINRLQLLDNLEAEGGFLYSFNRVTLCVVPTGKFSARVSWSICSIAEKFNRKRGEWVALERMSAGIYLPLEFLGNFGLTAEYVKNGKRIQSLDEWCSLIQI